MDFTSLEIFLAVAEHASVTRAATAAGRAPSNVTNRVRALEEELGVELFSRQGKKMTLTRDGRTFRSYASRLLALGKEARDALKPSAMPNILRVGSMESTAATRLPLVLQAFNLAHPDIAVRLTMGSSEELTRAVLAEEIDCALIARMPADIVDARSEMLDDLDAEPIYEEEVLIVLPASHPPITTVADVRVTSLAALEPGCTYRRVAETWTRPAGSITTTEVSSYHAILASVAAGDAIGVMPRSVFDLMDWPGAVRIHPLRAVQTLLVCRKGSRSQAVEILHQAMLANPGLSAR